MRAPRGCDYVLDESVICYSASADCIKEQKGTITLFTEVARTCCSGLSN